MATYGSDQVAFVLIDGYDVRGQLTTLEDNREANLEDVTVLGESWESHAATGVKRYELTQEGFYDDAAGAINDALAGTSGAARVVAFGYAGNTAGQPFVGAAGPLQSSYQRAAAVNELTKAVAEYNASGAIEDGAIVHALGAETAASGNTEAAAVDSGAPSSDGGAAYLAVTALTLDGGTGLTVRARHSADDITYADLATFATVTTAPDAERVTFAGTVNRYLAVAWTFNGSAGAARIASFMVGVARS